VTVENRRIYSKHDTGRFPSEAEIVEMVKAEGKG
jgi:hypothetical protein